MAIEPLILVVDDYADARAMSTARLCASRYRVAAVGCDGLVEMPRPAPALTRALARVIAQASSGALESPA